MRNLQMRLRPAPNVPGGAIGKSLEEQIGTGQGDEMTPGSSIYLIRRDPARSVRRGRQLFQRKFTLEQGHGPRVSPDSTGDIRPTLVSGRGSSIAAQVVMDVHVARLALGVMWQPAPIAEMRLISLGSGLSKCSQMKLRPICVPSEKTR